MKPRTIGILAAVAVLVVVGNLWIALQPAGAPRLSVKELSAVPVVTMRPYDEAADADKAVDAAFARARTSGKRVLIDLGGNWCPDCIMLANVMHLPQMQRFLDKHFEVVMVDVGRFDRNLQVPARFGIKQRLAGVPAVLVTTMDGKLVNGADYTTLANATTMTPQSIADWLARWIK